MDPLNADEVRRAVQAALSEDIGTGDVSTQALISEKAVAKAVIVGREPFIVAGLALAEAATLARATRAHLRG